MNSHSIVMGAVSSYRTRLFWRQQAWRLRNAVPQDGSRSVNLFSNFAALDHRGYADTLCALLETLCARSGGRFVTTAADARQRLKREIGLQSCVAVLATAGGAVGGYAWARVTAGPDAIAQFRQAPGLSALDAPDWDAVSALIKNKRTLAFYDIGLDTHYRRGFLPLKMLLKPLFELGVTHRAQNALWWAQRGSALHAISLAFGARTLIERKDCVFLQHSDIASIARVLAVLPASEISNLLARIAPRRAVQPHDADVTVRARRDLRQPAAAEPALAPASPARATAGAVTHNVAAGVGRQRADGQPATVAAVSLPAGTRTVHKDTGSKTAGPALPDSAPLHALPARLAALFPRLAS